MIEAEPKNIEAWLGCANLVHKANFKEETEKVLLKALEVNPSNPQLLFSLVNHYLKCMYSKDSQTRAKRINLYLPKCKQSLIEMHASCQTESEKAEALFVEASMNAFYSRNFLYLPENFGMNLEASDVKKQMLEFLSKSADCFKKSFEVSSKLMDKIFEIFPLQTGELVNLATVASFEFPLLVKFVKKRISSVAVIHCKDFSFLSPETENVFFCEFLGSCKCLQTLELCPKLLTTKKYSSVILQVISNNSPTLQRISLPNIEMKEEDWIDFFQQFPENLILSSFALSSLSLTDKSLQKLKKSSSITSIDVTLLYTLVSHSSIFQNCFFKISETSITREGLKHLYSMKLTSVALSNLQLDPSDLCELVENVPTLTNLDISHNQSLHFPGLIQILKANPNIARLNLLGCSGVKTNQLYQLDNVSCLIIDPQGNDVNYSTSKCHTILFNSFNQFLDISIGEIKFHLATQGMPNSITNVFCKNGVKLNKIFSLKLANTFNATHVSILFEGQEECKLVKNLNPLNNFSFRFSLYGKTFTLSLNKNSISINATIRLDSSTVASILIQGNSHKINIMPKQCIPLMFTLCIGVILLECKKL